MAFRIDAVTFCSAAYIAGHEIEVSAERAAGKGLERDKIMNIAQKLTTWRKYRETVNELGRMSDRELNDLGIGRADIRRVARSAVGF